MEKDFGCIAVENRVSTLAKDCGFLAMEKNCGCSQIPERVGE
jgi:hypothetical protein